MLKYIVILLSAFVLAGCTSNPVSNMESVSGIKKLNIQEISDVDLYYKKDDDLGLYDISFYQYIGSSMWTWELARDDAVSKAKAFCGEKDRSSHLGDRVKAKPIILSVSGAIGFFEDEYVVTFVCADSAFTKNNQHLLDRFQEISRTTKEVMEKELSDELQRQQKSMDDSVSGFADGFSNGLNRSMNTYQQYNPINCTTSVLTGQTTCY